MGAHRQSVSRGARALGESGLRGLRKAARAGRLAKLSTAQLREVDRALKLGPEACGYVRDCGPPVGCAASSRTVPRRTLGRRRPHLVELLLPALPGYHRLLGAGQPVPLQLSYAGLSKS